MRSAGKTTGRKGVFIGAYIPGELKQSIERRAKAENRTLSQEVTKIPAAALHGGGAPPGSPDRRGPSSVPRRREEDPGGRRRINDLPVIPAEQREGRGVSDRRSRKGRG